MPKTSYWRNKRKYKSNKTAVTGVRLVENKKGYYYYTAQWYGLNKKFNLKTFSVLKYGKDKAFQMAREYRQRVIEELNKQGAGYTERHGKEI